MGLLQEGNSEVLLRVVGGLAKIARVAGDELLGSALLTNLDNLRTKPGSEWRVRAAVLGLYGDLGLQFGKDLFIKHLQAAFFTYLSDSAAGARETGVAKSAVLAESFGEDWVVSHYIKAVTTAYSVEKRGYNYRICCLHSLSGILGCITKDTCSKYVIPIFLRATQDSIPNVRFSVCRIILQRRSHFDANMFSEHLLSPLKGLA